MSDLLFLLEVVLCTMGVARVRGRSGHFFFLNFLVSLFSDFRIFPHTALRNTVKGSEGLSKLYGPYEKRYEGWEGVKKNSISALRNYWMSPISIKIKI